MSHLFSLRVYYEDTDMGGIVYHANYLKFIERARSDWVRARGIDQNRLRATGVVFAVRRIEADFLAPARLDDTLEVTTVLEEVRGARLTLSQDVSLDARPLFRARVQLAAIDMTSGAPRRLPAELRQAAG